jgi:hypothetical protein
MNLLEMPYPRATACRPKKIAPPSSAGRFRGGLPKLNPDLVRKIRELYAAGQGNTYTLAERFGVGQAAIVKIINRKSWRNVE